MVVSSARLAVLLGLCLACSLGQAEAAQASETVDRIAAVVGEDVITLTEVYALGEAFIEEAASEAGPGGRRSAELDVLDALVQRRLISQEITRLGLDVTDTELDRTVDDIAGRNGLERDTLRVEVERSGMPWEEYKEELRENLRQLKFNQAVIQPRITVNEDELLAAYKKALRDVNLPRLVTLGALFIEVPPEADPAFVADAAARAKAAVARVRGGEPFAQVSLEVDESVYGKQGGTMGTYKQGELVAALDKPAFALETGGTTDPITMPGGIWVLHVQDSRTLEPPSFEGMREDLLQEVYSGRIDEETEIWTRQARRRSAIDVKLEPPPGPFQ